MIDERLLREYLHLILSEADTVQTDDSSSDQKTGATTGIPGGKAGSPSGVNLSDKNAVSKAIKSAAMSLGGEKVSKAIGNFSASSDIAAGTVKIGTKKYKITIQTAT